MMPFAKELCLLLPSLAKEEGVTHLPFATKMCPPAVSHWNEEAVGVLAASPQTTRLAR